MRQASPFKVRAASLTVDTRFNAQATAACVQRAHNIPRATEISNP